MKKRIIFLLVFIIPHFSVIAQTQAALLKEILSESQIDSLNNILKDLTGENQVSIDGQYHTITGRYAFSVGGELASQYIKQKLSNYGYKVMTQSFSSYGTNVIAKKTGILYPDKKYIICAHYDTMPYIDLSPGADDNGSGTAAVIEIARILKDYESNYTTVFAFWDEEENGLVGSNYFATNAFDSGDEILGVINLDMIGYNANDNLSEILTVENSVVLANKMIEINTELEIGLKLNLHVEEQPDGSDEMSFQQYGFMAVLLEELVPRSYPYYHQYTDTYDKIDHEYHFKNTQLALSTLAHLVEVTKVTAIDNNLIFHNFTLEQNYPNPFNPTTKINFTIPTSSHVTIKVYDLLGKEIKVLVNEYKKAGSYEVDFNADKLASGIYFYTLKYEGNFSTKKMVLLR